jgi:putative endonuclease
MLQHNSGQSKHTSKYKPWRVVWYASFESKQKAEGFEKYLKTASGKAFMNKRLI